MNSIDVDLSKNLLAPDFTTKGGKYLYPQSALQTGQKNVVKIKMTGTRNADFEAANQMAGFKGNLTPAITNENGTIQSFVWHHMDDLEIINGEAYCTMQLVESKAHNTIYVSGMSHSASVAQYKTYFGYGY
jgi:hypothetical protein